MSSLVPPTTARPCLIVATSTSPHRAPPPTRAVDEALSTSTVRKDLCKRTISDQLRYPSKSSTRAAPLEINHNPTLGRTRSVRRVPSSLDDNLHALLSSPLQNGSNVLLVAWVDDRARPLDRVSEEAEDGRLVLRLRVERGEMGSDLSSLHFQVEERRTESGRTTGPLTPEVSLVMAAAEIMVLGWS